MRILLKNCPNDILIEDKIITKIEKNINESADEIIDCNGMYVSSGFVDLHCHLREPGFEYKEKISTGTHAAAAGGFTAVVAMANTKPVCDSVQTVEYILNEAKENGYCKVYPVCAVTKGFKGQELTDFEELKNAGVKVFSDDGMPVEDALIMKRALLEADKHNVIVVSHCEENTREKTQWRNPKSAEIIMAARECILSKETGCHVHIAHISCKESVEIIRSYKKMGAPVTAETCPHYFSLTAKDVEKYGTLAKMNPPLCDEEDRLAVIEGLKDGTIDAISTDHAPHSEEEKQRGLFDAPNGIIGLETALGVSITYLYKTGFMSLEEICEKLSTNPCRILGINHDIKVGNIANITVFDADKKYIFDKNKSFSLAKNTPYDSFELYGKNMLTISDGVITYNELN